MNNFAKLCKKYYDKGLYTLAALKTLVEKGKLSQTDYAEITGEAYE